MKQEVKKALPPSIVAFYKRMRIQTYIWQKTVKNEFCPDWPGLFTNPVYLARRGIWDALRTHRDVFEGTVLDFGSGCQPYRELFAGSQYLTLEYDTEENRAKKIADYFYDGKTIPIADASIDCVLCTEVLEHVPNPAEVLREIERILKPGGRVFLTTPFMWSEHEQPYDFQRFTSFGLKKLFTECGYTVTVQEKLGKRPIAAAQLFTVWLLNTILRPAFARPRLAFAITALLIAPIHGMALLLERLTRTCACTEEWYLDNLVIAEKRP